MKYVAKRPAVEAIQFTGLKSVHDIKFLSRAFSIRYEERIGGTELYAEINAGLTGIARTIEVRRGDYVVRDGDNINVMSEEAFEAKYERAEPEVVFGSTLTNTDIANLNTPRYQLQRDENGFITGVTAEPVGTVTNSTINTTTIKG